ncbi:MAG: hypothetical protein FJX61_14740 [Alphaproteobacteria bacterium]|nr:hypothetical protein [Alphaproteobacteria bacterium]
MPYYSFEGKSPSVEWTAYVHPDAVLIGDVVIGAGCYIAAGAVLRADWGRIEVGAGSNVQDNCVIHVFPDRVTALGPASHIAHGAIIHGATLDRHAVVGINATVLDFAELGADSVVGSNALVPAKMKVPTRSLAVGVPAKVVRELTPEELAQWRAATEVYQDLAKRSRAGLRRLKD